MLGASPNDCRLAVLTLNALVAHFLYALYTQSLYDLNGPTLKRLPQPPSKRHFPPSVNKIVSYSYGFMHLWPYKDLFIAQNHLTQ